MRARFTAFTGRILCLLLLLSWEAHAAENRIPPEEYARINAAVLDHHILPRYERLAIAASGLAHSAESFCTDAGDAALADVREAYQDAMDAWMGAQQSRINRARAPGGAPAR